MDADPVVAVRWYAAARALFGAALLLAPKRALRGVVGETAAAAKPVQALGRLVGVRDLVLALGTLAAAGEEDTASIRRFAMYGAACDGTDLMAILLAYRAMPARTRTGAAVAALAGAATGGWIASAAD